MILIFQSLQFPIQLDFTTKFKHVFFEYVLNIISRFLRNRYNNSLMLSESDAVYNLRRL
jgi:hypothetical protein